MVAYAAITVAIVVPVRNAGQLRTNKLAVATALIFFSCAVGHGLHAFLAYRSITAATGGTGGTHLGHMMNESWPTAIWDLLTAAVGVYYWTLRRGYGVLLGKGAMYVSPWEQRRLDESAARERAARDVAESHLVTLTAVVEHTDAALIGIDLYGIVTAWNAGAEQMFGWTADEMIGRSVGVLTDEPGQEQQQDVQARVREGERNISYEARRIRKDGSPIELSISLAAVRETSGEVTGTSVVARDIGAAKEAADRARALEERTHQQQRMESLGKLAGGVAHDFNNILAIIVNYTEFAAEASADPAVRADLEHVRTAADRAMNLTRQLLTFTRGDTIQPQDIDLRDAIAEVRAMLDRTIGEDIALFARQPKQALIVHGDPGQLQQVLLNLALNARDAMPDGGTLVIEADEAELDGQEINMQPSVAAGPYARIQVSDTGEGMSAEVATHIFEPFYTTKPRGKGTGLGLATVYGIVAEAGGSINVFSELGVGTTFRIYLPLATESAGPASTGTRLMVPPKGNGQRVLVVEDEAPLARVVHRILTGNGYRVLAASTGAEGLQLYLDKGCDALLTDVIMPEMSGPRLAELVHERQPGLPVVYMSGYSNGLLGSSGVLDSDIPFLEKPFASTDLLHKLHEALSRAPSGQPRTGAPR
ncbi:PAS domain S-box-containing protein [Actinoplanes tereljensis]|nr:PAS domain S-box protein [Actinoplanes tereljensis]